MRARVHGEAVRHAGHRTLTSSRSTSAKSLRGNSRHFDQLYGGPVHEAVEVGETTASQFGKGERCRESDVDSFPDLPEVLEERVDAVDDVGEVMDAVAAVRLQELGIRRGDPEDADRLDQLDLGRAGTAESVARDVTAGAPCSWASSKSTFWTCSVVTPPRRS